jgi:hypothetical protein
MSVSASAGRPAVMHDVARLAGVSHQTVSRLGRAGAALLTPLPKNRFRDPAAIGDDPAMPSNDAARALNAPAAAVGATQQAGLTGRYPTAQS